MFLHDHHLEQQSAIHPDGHCTTVFSTLLLSWHMGAKCQFPFEPFHSCLFASFTLIFCSLYWMLSLLRKIASLGRQYLVLIKSDPSLPCYFWSRENILLTLVIKSRLPLSVRVLCILHRNPPSPSLLCLNSLCLSFTLTFGVPSFRSLP